MKQCQDADRLKRPDVNTLWNKIAEINQSKSNQSNQSETNNSLKINNPLENYTNSSRLFTSKLYQFENLPEPRNATEGIILINFFYY